MLLLYLRHVVNSFVATCHSLTQNHEIVIWLYGCQFQVDNSLCFTEFCNLSKHKLIYNQHWVIVSVWVHLVCRT